MLRSSTAACRLSRSRAIGVTALAIGLVTACGARGEGTSGAVDASGSVADGSGTDAPADVEGTDDGGPEAGDAGQDAADAAGVLDAPEQEGATDAADHDASDAATHDASDAGCVPSTCAGQGFECGMNTDGCGDILDCGRCPPGQVCGVGGFSKCGNPLDGG
jgi:hypothetical protein